MRISTATVSSVCASCTCAVAVCLALFAVDAAAGALVAGSFASRERAVAEAERVTTLTGLEVRLVSVPAGNGVLQRLVVPLGALPEVEGRLRLRQAGIERPWRLAGFEDSSRGDQRVTGHAGAARVAAVDRAPADSPARKARSADSPAPFAAAPAPVKPVPVAARTLVRLDRRGWQAAYPQRTTHGTLRASIALEARLFDGGGPFGRDRGHGSVSLMPEYFLVRGDDLFEFTPFYRHDARDADRSHFDIRDLSWSRVLGDFELRAGIRRVFWGVTELQHLVDIVNQTDALENPDGEDKLGQPMVNLSWVSPVGIADVYVMPWFRERRYPGVHGRLGLPFHVDTRGTTFESGAEQAHVDVAVRWSHSIGALDLGLSHFAGTSREPRPDLNVAVDAGGMPVSATIVPHYAQMQQTGLDAQYIAGDWVLKLESVYRTSGNQRYSAATAGFEKTVVGLFGSRFDLGIVGEYLWDGRGELSPSLFEDDVALGLRLTTNNALETSFLLVWVGDRQTRERSLLLEGSTRLGESWKVVVEGAAFGGGRAPESAGVADLLMALRDPLNKTSLLQDENFLKVEVVRYF